MAESIRIDKLLWFLRLAANRSLAQQWATSGHIRRNGLRVERASAAVRTGDVLVLVLRGTVRVIEVIALPVRRGPAAEAQSCYRMITTPDVPGDAGMADCGSGLTGAP